MTQTQANVTVDDCLQAIVAKGGDLARAAESLGIDQADLTLLVTSAPDAYETLTARFRVAMLLDTVSMYAVARRHMLSAIGDMKPDEVRKSFQNIAETLVALTDAHVQTNVTEHVYRIMPTHVREALALLAPNAVPHPDDPDLDNDQDHFIEGAFEESDAA